MPRSIRYLCWLQSRNIYHESSCHRYRVPSSPALFVYLQKVRHAYHILAHLGPHLSAILLPISPLAQYTYESDLQSLRIPRQRFWLAESLPRHPTSVPLLSPPPTSIEGTEDFLALYLTSLSSVSLSQASRLLLPDTTATHWSGRRPHLRPPATAGHLPVQPPPRINRLTYRYAEAIPAQAVPPTKYEWNDLHGFVSEYRRVMSRGLLRLA